MEIRMTTTSIAKKSSTTNIVCSHCRMKTTNRKFNFSLMRASHTKKLQQQKPTDDGCKRVRGIFGTGMIDTVEIANVFEVQYFEPPHSSHSKPYRPPAACEWLAFRRFWRCNVPRRWEILPESTSRRRTNVPTDQIHSNKLKAIQLQKARDSRPGPP